MSELLTRTLQIKVPLMTGLDVEAWTRGAHRYLQDGQLGAYEKQRESVRRTWGPGKAELAKKCSKKAGLPQTGRVGKDGLLMKEMEDAGAFDALSVFQFETYKKLHTIPPLVYPHASGFSSSVCQGLHPTAGLDENWAIDFCAPGGTLVVAVEDAEIIKLSGRDPSIPPDNLVGIWGLSIHYRTPQFKHYFSTHYGSRTVRVGQKVKAGDVIGQVGSWPGDPGRSHTHLGVTSPRGRRDAQQRILQVSRAPRVEVDV